MEIGTDCNLLIGRRPSDDARLLGRNGDEITAVVIDLDDCEYGTVWLEALTPLARKIPAIAVSRLDSRFLQPLARRHGADDWVSEPIDPQSFAKVLKSLSPRPEQYPH